MIGALAIALLGIVWSFSISMIELKEDMDSWKAWSNFIVNGVLVFLVGGALINYLMNIYPIVNGR